MADTEIPTFERAKATLAIIEPMIAHEFAQIGNRMTWLTISQSFLFAAYATVATDPSRMQVTSITLTTKMLLLLIPFVGLVFSAVVAFSVYAAKSVLEKLIAVRGEMILQINKCTSENDAAFLLPLVGGKRQRNPGELSWTVFLGDLPVFVLPWAMVVMWLAAVAVRLI